MSSQSRFKFIRRTFISPIREFIHDSRAVGITLICVTALSLIISNSGWGKSYISFWEKEIHFPVSAINLPHSYLHIINDGLMAIFFFLVGSEIKRELLIGELSSIKKSLLPLIAAVGGMVVPAAIYWIWCGRSEYSSGWGIPMATDIAFSLGILSLLGRRAPLQLRIFLTALAIIDDLGAILAIAIFYSESINLLYLFSALGLFGLLCLLNYLKVKRYRYYFVLGFLLWYLVFNSGVHATVAGVLLAFTMPLGKIVNLEHKLHDPVSFGILPLFAFANTAIIIPQEFGFIYSSIVHHGIFMGLVIGKPLGIFTFSWIAVKLGFAELPYGIRWAHILGMGLIAGIGFTMSIFISTLAFDLPGIQVIAKVAIIEASLTAGLLGFFYLKWLDGKSLQRKVVRSMDQNY